MFRQKPHLSTTVLLTIATFDLVTTLMWLNIGGMEGNPLFAYVAKFGSLALVAAKFVYVLIPIAILEYARTKRPMSAEIGTWAAAALYACLYISHLLQIRMHMPQ
ncbi:DUF5658 family protein [Fimbriimonas ginsengisoli]|uniref:DUF5658 domain-containing protein n=1 Tax=Fimbriimonas ginsengisoli Gsoil 348 TaxID=661478 RepID=A0A068NX08_FIMGI|nr:DUF5658 family protein [Fimbriimonas ginsengisoli]AIE87320.1 hypothetical protein OP10G_3952 [Fimbriimonas ginsengisoli Gsoil 348]